MNVSDMKNHVKYWMSPEEHGRAIGMLQTDYSTPNVRFWEYSMVFPIIQFCCVDYK
jgi:hypothetical protein